MQSLGISGYDASILLRVSPDGHTAHAYKRSTHPTSVPLSKLFTNSFPLSVRESLEDYGYRHNPLKFQHDLLSTLPFYPHPDSSGTAAKVLQTPIDEHGNFINEFVISPQGNFQEPNHLIMIHGYGGGLGFYLKNFEALAKEKNWCIHAIDLLGYGCSSRPKFVGKNLQEVENWFHDSYSEWLRLRGLDQARDKTLIMAHSMGAYLMGTYGINRDPDFCKKLLMVSPGAIIKHRKQVFVPKYFAKLWEQNISPFSLVRGSGPFGSKLVSMWSSRRFAKLSSNESRLLHKYAYGIFNSPGSGEYMLNFLLAPGADARHPLVERGVHKLKCKLSWWYGKEDWMDPKGGELCSNIINNLRGEVVSDVKLIEDSGHHIYLDNITRFNSMLVNEMRDMEKDEAT
ncbi:uncharacterized protein SPAPADRAFT_73056 [Spathaspora passalidarum NRRL Y-27907]|uniref:AB hydrolase-1 domain-containing protein n=1 Tax=Spathaspora passalidarum (strain NRRL Y-27907 / 11-Y1) TaxID=619300 RepID=G3ATR3_SPAPN|nr:uncharacterized protein SPAPADRAFT_73056 [Spathaspora passalidarum NRRL Y-27907]EGW30289.1 hypothetical protein SPAPADRAFT_73056 [Spathaspora passalidarum NRRL Y-27907]